MDAILADLPALVSLGPALALVVVMARLWRTAERDHRLERTDLRMRIDRLQQSHQTETDRLHEEIRKLHERLDAERERRRAAEDR